MRYLRALGGETTAKNLQFIIDAGHPRGEDCGWMHALVAALRLSPAF